MTTYSLLNDYGWLTIDANTGAINATSTTLISGRFNVQVVETNGTDVANHYFNVEVYFTPSNAANNSDLSLELAPTTVGEMIRSSNVYGSKSIPASPTSIYPHWLFFIKKDYSNLEIDVVIVDDENATSVLEQHDRVSSNGYSVSGLLGVRTDEWKLYLNGYDYSNGQRVIYTYDPSTKTILWDEVPMSSLISGEQSQIEIDPLTRKAIITGNSGGNVYVASIDTSTNTLSTPIAIVVGRSVALGVGADADYLYAVGGNSPTQQLCRATRDGVTVAVIAETTDNYGDINLHQHGLGVRATFVSVVGYADGDYWIYNDTFTLVTNVDTPFGGGVSPELAGVMGYVSAGESAVADSGLTTFYCRSDGGTRVNEYQHTVRTYGYELVNVIPHGSNSLFMTASNYGGLADYNPLTTNKNILASSTSRTRAIKTSLGNTVYGGYPSCHTSKYVPSTEVSSFLGYAGGDNAPSRAHYYQGFAEVGGIIYGSSVQYRVAYGGAFIWFDESDFANTLGGYNDTDNAILTNYGLNNCVAIGTNIIASSYISTTATTEVDALIFIFDTLTKTISATHSLGTDLVTTGFISKVVGSTTDIIGVSALPDLSLVIYRMNTVTGAIVYKHNYAPLRSYLEQDTFQGDMFDPISDGQGNCYIVAYRSLGNYHILRINESTGGVEFVGHLTQHVTLAYANGNLYQVSRDTNAYVKVDISSVSNMPMAVLSYGAEMVLNSDFSLGSNNWYEGTNSDWVFDGISATYTDTLSGKSEFMYQDIPMVTGKTYLLTVTDMTCNTGTILFKLGNDNFISVSNGTNTYEFVKVGTNNTLNCSPSVNTSVVFKGYSVKEQINLLA